MHRTPQSGWGRWWPFVVAIVVLPALAFGLVTFLSSWDGLPRAGAGGTETTPAAEETTEQTPDPTEPAPEETSPETEEPTPTVPPADLARTVRVENATTTSGLAGGARGTLEDAGYTDVSTGNWAGGDEPASVVYYPAEEDLGTASEVALLLGIARVELSAEIAGDRVLVILESDFQP